MEVDGQPLGTSDQPEVFELPEGQYQLILKRDNKILTQNIKMYADRETIVKVHFDKGDIRVSYEPE